MSTSKLSKILSIPMYQRPENQIHIDNIFNSIKNIIQKQNIPKLTGCLILTKKLNSDIYDLIDGNHRFSAYLKILNELQFDIKTFVQIIYTESEYESKDLFSIVNKNLPCPQLTKGVQQSEVNEIINYFIKEYKIFSDSENSKRPFISKKLFSKFISDLISRNINNIVIIDTLKKYNEDLKSKNWMYFRYSTKDNQDNLEKLMKKASDKKCFLGLVKINKLYEPFNLNIPVLKRVSINRALR